MHLTSVTSTTSTGNALVKMTHRKLTLKTTLVTCFFIVFGIFGIFGFTDSSESSGKSYDGFVIVDVVNADLRDNPHFRNYLIEISKRSEIEVFPHPDQLVPGRTVSILLPPSLRQQVKRKMKKLISNKSTFFERTLESALALANRKEYRPKSKQKTRTTKASEENREAEESQRRRRKRNSESGGAEQGGNVTDSGSALPVDDVLGRWARLHEIDAWLEAMVRQHPSSAAIFFAGRSEEGRILKGIKIGRGNEKSPVIWIHAGIHAREWIAPATAVYLIHRLLTSREDKIQKILDETIIYILPIANPDGYVYSMDCDRLWRKNLKGGSSKYCCVNGQACFRCFGVDLNRNWNIAFNSVGTSNWPCDQTFAGGFAFSEAETRSIGYTIQVMSPRVKAFLTLHSYGQIWAMPWVHKPSHTNDHQELLELSKRATDAASKAYGGTWTYGPGYFSVYPIGGCSMDWAKRDGIKYSYTVELRPHTNTSYPYGFIRPYTDIIPSGEEVWPGIVILAQKVFDEWKMENLEKKMENLERKMDPSPNLSPNSSSTSNSTSNSNSDPLE